MTTMSYVKSDISPSEFQCKLLTAQQQRVTLWRAISVLIVNLFSGFQVISKRDGQAAEVARGG
jgi:hypothetical protein